MANERKGRPAQNVLEASWPGFASVGVFSFFVNLGALTSPLYMQQIFDRVMQSRHLETLLYLTVITIFFLGIIAVLDAVRGSLLARIARWWDETVHAELLAAICGGGRPRLRRHLRQLTAAGLLIRCGRRYRFAYRLLHRTAWQMLTERARTGLRRKLATARRRAR